MKLVILITGQLEEGLETAQQWRERGAPGVTMIRSHGIHSLRQAVERGEIELPRLTFSVASAMAALIDNMEPNGVILISVVEDEQVDLLIQIASEVMGDLSLPNNGVLFVLPVERAIGVYNDFNR